MSKWHPHTLGQLPYAVDRMDGVLLDEALGGSLDHDEALGGCLDPFVAIMLPLVENSLPKPWVDGRHSSGAAPHSGQALNVAPFAQTA